MNDEMWEECLACDDGSKQNALELANMALRGVEFYQSAAMCLREAAKIGAAHKAQESATWWNEVFGNWLAEAKSRPVEPNSLEI